MRRIGVVVAVTAASMLAFGGVAAAHECFIENRSDKGDAQAAANSANWEALTPEVIATFFPVDAECFVDYWLDNGGPASITVNMKKTIGEGSANPNLANGKGLEHASQVFGPLVGGAIEACGLPPAP